MNPRFAYVAACMAASMFMAAGSSALAVNVAFDIDETQSMLTITGDVAGVVPFNPQFPGSTEVFFDGTIAADLLYGPDTIRFYGGSVVDALLLGTPVAPLAGGAPGTAPGDAGLIIGEPENSLGDVAVRDFIANLGSGAIALAGTNFDASDITLFTDDGVADYNVSGFGAGQAEIAGLGEVNNAAGGMLVTVGLDQTLTIPVSVSLTVRISDSPEIDAHINLNGQLVATRTVPEPGTIVLLALGLAAVVPLGRRRLRAAR